MKVLYYDCFSGISGDMNLGAMIDLGVDKELLLKAFSSLSLDEEYEIYIGKERKKGIAGTRVEIKLNRTHGHHHHKARNIKDILRIINESTLFPQVKKKSMEMFNLLGKAEAEVHGTTIDQIHFHEVGATDAILDIVGAAFCFDHLQADKVIASSIELGGGFVRCEHGILPVPAPAVLSILKNMPVKKGGVQSEATTPTGAVILAANVDEFSDELNIVMEKTGYGIGKKDFEIPNVLRVNFGQVPTQKEKRAGKTYESSICWNISNEDGLLSETQYMVETNIDDMNPEHYEYAEERLFAAGALDVYKTPVIMKKSRPAIKLSVLTKKEDIHKIVDIIYRETSAIGLKMYPVLKRMLPREVVQLATKYGPVSVKYSHYKGLIKSKPEYEDYKRLAADKGIPLNKLYTEIIRQIGIEEGGEKGEEK